VLSGEASTKFVIVPDRVADADTLHTTEYTLRYNFGGFVLFSWTSQIPGSEHVIRFWVSLLIFLPTMLDHSGKKTEPVFGDAVFLSFQSRV
jgi:hypothetical protein